MGKVTAEMLEDEGYIVGQDIEDAVYILADGSLWDAGSDMGMRGVEHREAESFSELDRYDGQKFWEDVTVRMGLIMLIPESREILVHPEQEVTAEQQKRIDEAVSRGYEVGELK